MNKALNDEKTARATDDLSSARKEVVRLRLLRGTVAMDRTKAAKREWHRLGLSLRQRDRALAALIQDGFAVPFFGEGGTLVIVRRPPLDSTP